MQSRQSRLKLFSFGLGILLPLLALAAPQQDPVVARLHFAGGNQLVLDPNASLFKKIGQLPATADFRAQVVRKSAEELAGTFAKQLNPAGPDASALLQPLVDNLINSESVSVFGGRPDAPLGFVLAVRLTEAQAKTWQENLGKIIGSAPEAFAASEFQGSQWKKVALHTIRAKEWLVVARGSDLATQENEILANLAKQGSPAVALKDAWLVADADWPRLAAWLPLSSSPFKLARTQVTLAMKNNKVRTTVTLNYPQPLQWTAKPWRVPTEHVRDPLVSFTAVRDVAPFMAPNSLFSKLKINPWNEQFYVWAMESMPIQTYGAMPVEHATNVLNDLETQLPGLVNPALRMDSCGAFVPSTNRDALIWRGIFPLAPILRAGSEKSGDFLLGEFVPQPALNKTKPAPPELFSQFTGHNELAYYDWELTQLRMMQWRPMTQVLPILKLTRQSYPALAASSKPPQGGNSTNHITNLLISRKAREVWLKAIQPELANANSVTELAIVGPSEAKLTRSSALGFTGFELVVLSEWLTRPAKLEFMPAAAMSGVAKPAAPVQPGPAPKK